MGWAGEVQKQKILPREHQMKKNSCYGLRKSYKKFDNEKFLRVENSPTSHSTPPPPHNVFNGPSHDERCRIGDQNLCLARRLITNVVAEDSLIDWLKIDIRTHVFW